MIVTAGVSMEECTNYGCCWDPDQVRRRSEEMRLIITNLPLPHLC